MVEAAGRSEVDVTVGARTVRVGARLRDEPVLAGGPLVVVWTVRVVRGADVYFGLGGDRARSRTGRMSFEAELEGTSDVVIVDPAAGVAELGGPLGIHEVSQKLFETPVLVNLYATVERARPAVAVGEQRVLLLTCHWDPLLAAQRDDVLGTAASTPVTLELRVPLVRDDPALRTLVRSRLATLLGAARPDDDALAELRALRYADAAELAAEIGASPERLRWVVEGLRTGT